MNGKLPLEYLLEILVENDQTFIKNTVMGLISELSKESLFEVQETVEEKLNA